MPRRARYLVPRGLPRRDEVLGAAVVLLVLAHVLFAQLTLIVAAVFYLVGRATRWRWTWLAGPAAAGAAWTVALGPRPAFAGFTAGPARVIRYLGAPGEQVRHLVHFTAAFAGIGGWLPRQLPLALVAGALEAALACWLTWLHTDEWNLPRNRPGLIVAARRVATLRSIRSGGVLTREGSCLGVTAGSGARVTVAWSEAAGGVSVCGSAAPDVLAAGFQLAHAAVRRRKPVLVVDHTGDPSLPGQLAAVCAAAGAPLQVFGDGWPGDGRDGAACYEPFRHGDPARRAGLVMAAVSWDGPARSYRRSCAAYLEDVFELIDAAPGDPRVPVLEEILHLLNPTAMRARMEYVPAAYPGRDALAARTRVSVDMINAEPATTAELARQLRELKASPFGRWLRPAGSGLATEIDLSRAVTDRAVILFRLPPAGPSPSVSAMLSRLICQDLLAAGGTLRGIGVPGDGIVWLAEAGPLPRGSVAELIARGPGTGLSVLAATTSAPAAVELAELTNVVVAHRIDDPAAARQLATITGAVPAAPSGAPPLGAPVPSAAPAAGLALSPAVAPGQGAGTAGQDAAVLRSPLAALRDGEFLLAVKQPARLVPLGRLVRARVPSPARIHRHAAPPRAADQAGHAVARRPAPPSLREGA